MAVNDSLNKDINRLVKPEKSPTPLQRVRTAEAIEASRGRGLYKGVSAVSGFVQNLRREVLTVYSSLILTEEGAFEKPPNWPTTGTYPGSAFELDTTVSYYEQRRVHYLLMESLVKSEDDDGNEVYSDPSIMEEQMYVPLAQPFQGDYYQGVDGPSDFRPALSMVISPASNNPAVAQVRDYLISKGVTLA